MAGSNGHNGNGRKLPTKTGDYEVGNCKPPVQYQFKPGNPGGPGRPSAGLSVREWWNQMADWTRAEVESACDDETAAVSKRAAARIWLYSSSDQTNGAGTPIAGTELERIMDQTAGKPKQAVEISGELTHKVHNAMGRVLLNPKKRQAAERFAEVLGDDGASG